jgi:hypothetical protein
VILRHKTAYCTNLPDFSARESNAVPGDFGGNMANDWLELRQHADTGIETIRAHFEGHAYDPHWHDSYLVGIPSAERRNFIAAVSVIAVRREMPSCSSLVKFTMVTRRLKAVSPT